MPLANLGDNLDDWLWGVPPGGVMLPVVAIQFDDLPKVNVGSEVLFHGVNVEVEAIGRKLDAVR